MLLLVTIGLVLVAAVTLVIGFVGNTLPLIYVSIICSVLAALVLFLYSRIGRRRAAPATAGGRSQAGPAPLPRRKSAGSTADDYGPSPRRGPKVLTGPGTSAPDYESDSEPEPTRSFRPPPRRAPAPAPAPPPTPRPAPAAAPAALAAAEAADEAPAPTGPVLASLSARPAPVAVPGAEAGAGAGADEGTDAAEGGDEPFFPIEDYDNLGVSEIMPLLFELDDDELAEVVAYEEAGLGRADIIARIEALLAEPVEEEPEETEPEGGSVEPEAEPVELPIADYDDLAVADILPLLVELDDEELWDVRDYEEAGEGRVVIIDRIDALLDAEFEVEPEEEEEEEPAPEAEAPEPEPEEAVAEAPTGPGEDFPIADYDHLRVAQIVPLLDQLDTDELWDVRDYEEAGSNRITIVARIDLLLGGESVHAEPEAVAAAAPAAAEPEPEEGGFPIADYDDLGVTAILPMLAELDDDELAEVRDHEESGSGRIVILNRIDALLGVEPDAEEPEAEEPEAETPPAAEPETGGEENAGDGFPIADYDDLGVTAILPMLAELDDDELEDVRDYEEAGQGRVVILNRIDALLGVEPGDEADEEEPETAEAETAEAEAAEEPEQEPEPEPEPEEGEYLFPIADYDQLSVTAILPLLAELDDDELEDVRDYEEAGQGRVAILNRIDALVEVEPEDEPEAAEIEEYEAEDEFEEEDEPEDEAAAVEAEAGATPGPVDEGAAEEYPFPIADYDELEEAAIVPLLAELDDDELEDVRDYEEAGQGRVVILERIDALLEMEPEGDDEAAAPEPAVEEGYQEDDFDDLPEDEVEPETVEEEEEEEPEEPTFPIADYDDLRVAEILPLLSQLTPEELQQVAEREEGAANRSTVLTRINRLLRVAETRE